MRIAVTKLPASIAWKQMPQALSVGSSSGMSRGAFWLLLQRVAVLAGTVDLVFLVVFFALGMPVIALANIVSASMYGAAYALLKRRKNFAAILLMWTEVVVHSAAMTLLLGWSTGFHYFLLVFIPAIVISRNVRHAVVAMVLLLAIYIGLDAIAQNVPVLYPLPSTTATALRWFSIGVVFIMFGYTGRYYSERVNEAEKRLQKTATTDPLTGLWNRRHLIETTSAEQARASRYGGELAVVLADIDHFKAVNDAHGHGGGDKAIQHIADLLRGQLRTADLLARWGGEEFLMILPSTNAQGALRLCERIRRQVEETPCTLDDARVTITLSFGIAPFHTALPMEQSIKGADDALYRAKARGRNRIELAPS